MAHSIPPLGRQLDAIAELRRMEQTAEERRDLKDNSRLLREWREATAKRLKMKPIHPEDK